MNTVNAADNYEELIRLKRGEIKLAEERLCSLDYSIGEVKKDMYHLRTDETVGSLAQKSLHSKEDKIAFDDMLQGLQSRWSFLKGIRSATEEHISELKEEGRVLMTTLQQMQDSVMSEAEEEDYMANLNSERKTIKLAKKKSTAAEGAALFKVNEETKGETSQEPGPTADEDLMPASSRGAGRHRSIPSGLPIYGKGKDCVSAPREFIAKYESCMKSEEFDKARWATVLPSKIEATPLMKIVEKWADEGVSWDQMKSLFMRHVLAKNDTVLAQQALHSVVRGKGEAVVEYTDRFFELIGLLGHDSNSELVVGYYLNGFRLEPLFRNKIDQSILNVHFGGKKINVQLVSELAKSQEALVLANGETLDKERSNAEKRSNDKPAMKSFVANEDNNGGARNNPRYGSEDFSTKKPYFKRSSWEPGGAKTTCFFCQLTGHREFECPAKRAGEVRVALPAPRVKAVRFEEEISEEQIPRVRAIRSWYKDDVVDTYCDDGVSDVMNGIFQLGSGA